MLIRRVLVQVLLISGIVLLLAACGGDPTPTEEAPPPTADTSTQVEAEATEETNTEETTTEEANTEETTTEETNTEETDTDSSQPEGDIAGFAVGERLLAWVAPAEAPGKQGSSAAGEVVFFDADGSTETVLNLPNGTTRVTACGPNAESPDGSTFAFMATVTAGGSETATLYLVNGTDSSLSNVAGDLSPSICAGSAPFEYSPDGSRFAYIDWPDNASTMASPFGRLRIFNTADANEVASFENVTAFDLTEDGAAFVSFYVDGDGVATEVAFSKWDGSSDSEVTSVPADSDNNCGFTSASIAESTSGLVAVVGYLCKSGDNRSTQWQFYQIDADNGTAQLEQSDNSGGSYFHYSDTNAIFVSPDGGSVLFTVPDGVSNQSVSLLATALDNVSSKVVLDRFGLMITVNDKPYDANNATAITSPDGRWLAIVVKDGNGNAELRVYDLQDMGSPISVGIANTGDTVASMAFAPDSSTLYYVAGADEGENNSLFKVNLTTGAESRISRGRYAQLAVSPDGNALAVMNWVEFNEDEPRYLTLEIHDLSGNNTSVIYEGGEVNSENKLENQSFAYPLSWRG